MDPILNHRLLQLLAVTRTVCPGPPPAGEASVRPPDAVASWAVSVRFSPGGSPCGYPAGPTPSLRPPGLAAIVLLSSNQLRKYPGSGLARLPSLMTAGFMAFKNRAKAVKEKKKRNSLG